MKETNTKQILDFLHFHTPTVEQKTTLNALSTFASSENSEDFFILSGAAGTGKTSITSALVGYLNKDEVKYRIIAPTGRAARILGKKTKTLSSTIHSLIYKPETNKETGVVNWKLKFNTASDFTIYIIDESSMISTVSNNNDLFQTNDSLLNHLIKFIKSGNSKNKIVLLGDKNQLPPYAENESLALDPNYLRNKYNFSGSFHYLTEVKRVEDGSYILKNANKLRLSIDNNETSMPHIDANKIKHVWAAAQDFSKNYSPENIDNIVAIGRSHKSNKMFNEEVRKNLFGSNVAFVVKTDLLIIQQNWKRGDAFLYNGDHVIVEDVDLTKVELVGGLKFVPIRIKAVALDGKSQIIDDYILLDTLLSEDCKIPFEKEKQLRAERFRKNAIYSKSGNAEDDRYVGAIRLGYGYSITCQKAQGGEWDKVYINTYGIQDKKWLYTAITRAKTDLNLY
jgi:exodeoxyribonuclease-5